MTSAAVDALYLHIPFCERKCEYCDFVSVAGARGQHEYVAALRSEVRALSPVLAGAELRTIFVGGGTPGLLDLALMSELMAEVRASFAIAADAEVTLEVNPSSSSLQRAVAWRDAGFNRVSVGVQSTHPDILAFLGRVHDAGRAIAALHEVREAGFDNVSADLIYAVPGLDDPRWQRDAAPGGRRGAGPRLVLRAHCRGRNPVAPLGGRGSGAGRRPRDGAPPARHRRGPPGPRRVRPVRGEQLRARWAASARTTSCTGAMVTTPPPASAPMVTSRRRWPLTSAWRPTRGPAPSATSTDATSPRTWPTAANNPLTVRNVEWIDGAMRDEEAIMLGLRLREGVVLERDGGAARGA